MNVDIRTGQIKVLEGFFNDLSTFNQRKIFFESFRKASVPLVAAAKAGAPMGKTGNLRRSIGTMQEPTRRIAILVGALRQRKGWHGHLIESGTKERVRRSGGSTGSVRGTQFFERAFNQTERQVNDALENEWYQAIDRTIIRTNKKLK